MDALPARAHFVGVGGVGMAGLAWLLHRLGCDVSGCDAKPDAATCAWLRAAGVRVPGAHDPAHLAAEKPDLVVRTPAVHDDNPELAAARAAGIPVVARGELLAGLSARFRTAAVCGSHGKTTTSTFLAAILRDLAPERTWWCIGGTSGGTAVAGAPAAAPGARPEAAAALLVAEADESDGTLARYRPALLVVTNVDLDHVDRFPSVAAFEEVFRRAIDRTAGPVVYGADHPRAAALARASGHDPIVSFGFSPEADFRILDWTPDGAGGQRFSLAVPAPAARGAGEPATGGAAAAGGAGEPATGGAAAAGGSGEPATGGAPAAGGAGEPAIGGAPAAGGAGEPAIGGAAAAGGSGEPSPVRLHLPLPGRHNALDAAAAIAAAAALGFPPEAAARALERTAALPARRFERIGSPAGFEVVSDYSHHPSEIRALVETARGVPHKRIVGVFQPHRYTRTKTFLADFPPAFAGLDELVLCPVYAASEPPLPGGSAADLYAAFRTAAAPGVPVPVYARSLEEAADWFRFNLREGDLVLVVGAGDVDALAPIVAAMRPAERPPETPRLGGYGTKAPVARLVDPTSEEELRAILAQGRETGRPPAVVGAGTNAIVAATGCARTVVRMRHPLSRNVLAEAHPPEPPGLVDVDAAVAGAGLLAFCRERGLSGLEPLVGIPGTVGGWLAMNAGTRFGSFCDRVAFVRAMGPDGRVRVLKRKDLRPGYRSCPGLEGSVALTVRVRLDPATPEAVDARMRELAAKRFDFAGLRTCGSVFRNPPAPLPPAGRLADEAGCRGLRVGGARVSDRHANVIAADPDATASDVLALVDLVRERVLAASGVGLVPEIRVLR